MEAHDLKKIINAIKDVITEANVECTEQGMALQCMDSSHVMLVYIMLREWGFDRYVISKNVTLGLNMTSVGKIMKIAKGDSLCTLKTLDDSDTLTFMFEDVGGKIDKKLNLKLMGIDAEHLGIPPTDYRARVKMPVTLFTELCKNCVLIGDAVTITVSGKMMKWVAKGDEIEDCALYVHGAGLFNDAPADDYQNTYITCGLDDVQTYLSLKYLTEAAKCASLADHVIIRIIENRPVRIEFHFGKTRTNDKGKVEHSSLMCYFMAPKVPDQVVMTDIEAETSAANAKLKASGKRKFDETDLPSDDHDSQGSVSNGSGSGTQTTGGGGFIAKRRLVDTASTVASTGHGSGSASASTSASVSVGSNSGSSG